jgi:hypothetical protein
MEQKGKECNKRERHTEKVFVRGVLKKVFNLPVGSPLSMTYFRLRQPFQHKQVQYKMGHWVKSGYDSKQNRTEQKGTERHRLTSTVYKILIRFLGMTVHIYLKMVINRMEQIGMDKCTDIY